MAQELEHNAIAAPVLFDALTIPRKVQLHIVERRKAAQAAYDDTQETHCCECEGVANIKCEWESYVHDSRAQGRTTDIVTASVCDCVVHPNCARVCELCYLHEGDIEPTSKTYRLCLCHNFDFRYARDEEASQFISEHPEWMIWNPDQPSTF